MIVFRGFETWIAQSVFAWCAVCSNIDDVGLVCNKISKIKERLSWRFHVGLCKTGSELSGLHFQLVSCLRKDIPGDTKQKVGDPMPWAFQEKTTRAQPDDPVLNGISHQRLLTQWPYLETAWCLLPISRRPCERQRLYLRIISVMPSIRVFFATGCTSM